MIKEKQTAIRDVTTRIPDPNLLDLDYNLIKI